MLTVNILWFIYIFTVIVLFVVGCCTLHSVRGRYPSTGCSTVLFIALIIGVLFVLTLSPLIEVVESGLQRDKLTLLFGLSFMLPVIVFLLVVWNGEHCSYSCPSEGEIKRRPAPVYVPPPPVIHNSR